MTINVALVTNDALILGCDSVASTIGHYLDPTKLIPKDENGNWIQDANGNWTVNFGFGDLDQLVTNAWGGVQKMFLLCGSQKKSHTSVAAITSGLAALSNRTMSNFAGDFHRQMSVKNPACDSVEAVVDEFLAFMGNHYDSFYAQSVVPDALKDDIEFLVGGYGRNDSLPSLFRVNLKGKSKVLNYSPIGDTARAGLAWGGQSTSVERLLRGYDAWLPFSIKREFETLYQSMSERALQMLQDTLNALNAKMPEGINTDFPAMPLLDDHFNRLRLDIDYQNMPVQDAIDFVAYLVNLESGKHKFVRGVPTVGGRTHIGLITRNEGFRIINPPALTVTSHTVGGSGSDLILL